ncbi:MAG: glycosyltransferase family 2 protein [Rhodospirillaceae bacterium]
MDDTVAGAQTDPSPVGSGQPSSQAGAGSLSDADTAPALRLSALIVAHNEERHLPLCLAALGFADEVVVVLDRCTDRSEEIARDAGAVIVTGAWPIEGDRRNLGIETCSGDWIVEVDADERVSPELAAELRATMTASAASGAYDYHPIPFVNYVAEKPVRFGWGAAFGVGAVPRLFRKGVKQWGPERIHPSLTFTGVKGPNLTHAMAHYVDDDLSDMINRFNRYTSSHAADLRATGKTGTLGRNLLRFPFRFYKCYVRRKGYREGGLGFLIALLAGLYPVVSHLKAKYDPEDRLPQ